MNNIIDPTYYQRNFENDLPNIESPGYLFQIKRVTSILKMGMISTEMRYENGMGTIGMNARTDFYAGGADSVFTQLFTKDLCENKVDLSDALYYQSNVRVLLSLDLLETGTYQYNFDNYGVRNVNKTFIDFWGAEESYLNRPSILEVVSEQTDPLRRDGDHEFMIKERVAPSMIKGLIVESQQDRDKLVSHLKWRRLIQMNAENQETILGIPIDKFIRIGTQITEALVT